MGVGESVKLSNGPLKSQTAIIKQANGTKYIIIRRLSCNPPKLLILNIVASFKPIPEFTKGSWSK
jgi:hypothetical protein